MRILQINAVYGQGSTGTIVRDIEHLCFESGIECYVASPDPKVREAKHGYVIGNTLDHKLHALLSRIQGKQAYFSHIPTRNLIRWMEQIKPDIVHLHNLHSNYIHLNMLLDYLAKKDIITVVTMHDCWYYTGGCFHYANVDCYKWLKSCGNCPKNRSDQKSILFDATSSILKDRRNFLLAIPRLHITGVSQWMAQEPLKSFLKDVPNYVIPNGIDLDVFKPALSDFRKRLKLEDKYIILGPASKWLDPVNADVLAVFAKSMSSDEVLLLFGSKNMNIKVPENVQLYGYTKDRKELSELYTAADVFANCSREDSLSLINVESQACGTPVVTFDQTGPKETVDNKCSFSVSVGDGAALYDAVQRVKKINSEELSIMCQRFVRDRYDVKANYNKYINLYKSI